MNKNVRPNLYCENFQKLKLWQNSKTLIVTKLKKKLNGKLKNLNCDKSQKLNLWQTQNGGTIENSNCDKTQKYLRKEKII